MCFECIRTAVDRGGGNGVAAWSVCICGRAKCTYASQYLRCTRHTPMSTCTRAHVHASARIRTHARGGPRRQRHHPWFFDNCGSAKYTLCHARKHAHEHSHIHTHTHAYTHTPTNARTCTCTRTPTRTHSHAPNREYRKVVDCPNRILYSMLSNPLLFPLNRHRIFCDMNAQIYMSILLLRATFIFNTLALLTCRAHLY